jgi:capsular polysaccharide biosynthesis protein
MELHDYVRTARRRWVLILGTAVLLAVVATLLTSLLERQYASTSRVFISTVSPDPAQSYQGGLFAEQRASSYAELVNGPELSKRVVDRLGLKMTAEELAERVDASVVPDTVVLRIVVHDTSSKESVRVNTAVTQELQSYVQELETPPGRKVPLVKATVIGAPDVSDSPVTPNRMLVAAAGFVLGLLLGYGLAILVELSHAEPTRKVQLEEAGEAA